MTFYLGTHIPGWLRRPEFRRVRLFVSVRALRVKCPAGPAVCGYAIDSGGFQELRLNGRWSFAPRSYLDSLLRVRDRLGPFDWAAQQDWMCEPFVLRRTRKSVRTHQRLTVENYLILRDAEPSLPIVPVLQGWHPDDYADHFGQFRAAGVDLTALPLVGVGSVCRRQRTREAAAVMSVVAGLGVKSHGFGFKMTGIRVCASAMRSADSLAWSYAARRVGPDPACPHGSPFYPGNCANCPRFALDWYYGITGELRGRGLYDPTDPVTNR